MLKKRRLTPTELTVVVIVTGLLVGLIVPTLNHLREIHRRSACLNNLKEIGLGIRLFSGDCGYAFPSDEARAALGAFNLLTTTNLWFSCPGLGRYQVGPIITNYQTWICPPMLESSQVALSDLWRAAMSATPMEGSV
jgi:hypothetical protein